MVTVPMAEAREPFAWHVDAGWCVGPWRRPVNNSSSEAGTIHSDETARRLGFAAGPVAGSIHFEQFEPLLRAVLGSVWARAGSLSLWFDTPAFDGDALQAAVEALAAPRRRVRLLRADGAQIAHGSASVGPDDAGEVRQRLAKLRPSEPTRMLASVPAGFEVRGLATRTSAAEVAQRLPVLTEVLPEHQARGDGAAELPLSTAIHAMRVHESHLPLTAPLGVGLFGAIEWQWLNGPMFADRDYAVAMRVVATGISPRSEMLWTETTLSDPATGQDVARMLMLSRLLKESSPLWKTGENKT